MSRGDASVGLKDGAKTSKRSMTFDVNLSSPYDQWGGFGPLAQAAVLAEELGFYGVQFGEHAVVPIGKGYTPSGLVWYDNFVLASHLATLTTRLRLIFNAIVLPYRPVVETAKLIATLDVLSKGRVIAGVAVGWV